MPCKVGFSTAQMNQRTVGRLALCALENTTNEAAKGDMKWATFNVREAQSKMSFEDRLRNMKESRSAEKVFRCLQRRALSHSGDKELVGSLANMRL